MYTGKLVRVPFQPDPTHMQHQAERDAYARCFLESEGTPLPEKTGGKKEPESLSRLLEMVSPEDSALIALILFLLCDNSENDPVLLGILLYVLLSN